MKYKDLNLIMCCSSEYLKICVIRNKDINYVLDETKRLCLSDHEKMLHAGSVLEDDVG